GFGAPGQQAGQGFGGPAGPPAPGYWQAPAPGQQNFKPPRSRPSAKILAAVTTAVVAVVVVVVVVVSVLAPSPKPKHTPPPVAAKPAVHVYHFSNGGPIAVALDGPSAWVA